MEENKNKYLDSKEIFDKERTIEIKHDGQSYYLKITKANKLILTK
ncbi:MAG: hemin uptake protein HemP [Aliarcobacter sp.]|nr:hemin uptake protein HemP [Aliarcobacter sp.]MDX9900450.1 hemin uptake protein HemP [Aliarcobacter sp.]